MNDSIFLFRKRLGEFTLICPKGLVKSSTLEFTSGMEQANNTIIERNHKRKGYDNVINIAGKYPKQCTDSDISHQKSNAISATQKKLCEIKKKKKKSNNDDKTKDQLQNYLEKGPNLR